ncbi:FMRFamide-activated amiloride-sensitive sodium channel-like [Pecten maximus]|uniref:FMRFamide-activated amiloride-sensitive sodium channel-like n=1 Tax=Pecten maximus TaxID=6579 RepID=UPI001458D29B|nr:FMRFamide-activated amiloride-sensitive sodium channel-like [Pecten maximus]
MNEYDPESRRIDGYIANRTSGYRDPPGRMDAYGGQGSERMDGHISESDRASKYIATGSRSVASLDSQGKKKSFGRVIERFAEKTSMQGVPYINLAKTRGAKIAWTILLICAIGMMVLHLYYLSNQFFLWPKTTPQLSTRQNLILQTLAVILVIRCQEPEPELAQGTGTGTVPGQPTGKRRKRSVQTYKDIDLTDYKQESPPKDTSVGPRDTVSDIEDTFKELYMNVDRDTRVSIGHSIDDMLVSCAFNGQTCYADNFTLFQTPSYGNCYTIQSPKFLSKTSGPSNGLKLILYVDNQDYIKGITQGHGARVTLHYPGTIPDPENMGFYVSTAFETDIGLKLVDIQREGQPYGECTDGEEFEKKYKRKYTRQACITTCEQEAILARCGCYHRDMQEVFYLAGKTNERACNTTAEIDCLADVQTEIEDKTLACSCLNPCTETQYVKAFSTRQWPTDDYSTVLVQSICETENRTDDCRHLATITDKTELSSNFLKVIIYYEDLNYEKIEEAPEIETAQFASDVGGAIGLWIGLSMLSMFEVVQLLVELCGFGASKCKRDEARKERARRKQQQRRQRMRQHDYFNKYGLEHGMARHNVNGMPPDYRVRHGVDGIPPDYRVRHDVDGVPPDYRARHGVDGMPPDYRVRHGVDGMPPDYREKYSTPNHSMNGYKEEDGYNYILYKGHSVSERH